MQKIDLEGIRLVQLEMMDDIHDFCVKNSIRYSLAGGSLLGAVKYKGYVPFDDDIDIMMPRPDYERFVKSYITDTDYVMDLRYSDSCREAFAKVCRRDTILTDPLLGRSTFPIFIDVCPVDGAPEHYEPFYRVLKQELEKVPRVCAFYKEIPKHKCFWFAKYLIKRLSTFPFENAVSCKLGIHNLLANNLFDNCPLAGELLVCKSNDEIYDAAIFTKYTEYDFEGRKYMGIVDYDTYLTIKYSFLGAYMNLPPLTKPVHDYEAFINVKSSLKCRSN